MDDALIVVLCALAVVLGCLILVLVGAADDHKNDCMNGAPIVYNKTVYHCVKG